MKKVVLVLLSVLLVMGVMLSGCSDKKPEASADSSAVTTEKASDDQAATDEAKADDTAKDAASSDTDWQNFTIDASKIPQEKLDTTIYLAQSIRGLENPYYATVMGGMDLFAEYLDSIGQKYEKQVLDSGASNDKEVDNVKQFAAKAGENGLLYSDPNESAIAPMLAEAVQETGGYIGTVWNRPDDVGPMDYTPNWVVHASPDGEKMAEATAKALFDKMGGKGKVFVLDGMLGNTAATERAKGFENILAQYPDIEVVAQDTGNWDAKQALNLVETWLNQYPDVAGIWCANDGMATGAIQGLDKAGLKGKIPVTGIDATADMIAAIDEGSALATVSSNGYMQGGYTLAILYAAWTGQLDVEALPEEFREFHSPSILVTADNVKEYIAEYVDNMPKYDFSKIFTYKES